MTFNRKILVQSFAGAVGFAALFALSLPAFPYLAVALHEVLPVRMLNFLYFWPQLTLLPYGFMLDETGGTEWYFKSIATPCAIFFWIVFAGLFGWASRKLNLLYRILLCYPVMLLMVFLFYLVLSIFGVGPYLDGP